MLVKIAVFKDNAAAIRPGFALIVGRIDVCAAYIIQFPVTVLQRSRDMPALPYGYGQDPFAL